MALEPLLQTLQKVTKVSIRLLTLTPSRPGAAPAFLRVKMLNTPPS